MTGFVDIIKKTKTQDSDGFTATSETVVQTVRCYREGRHGSIRWANLAAFSEATDLFRIRTIPGFELTREYLLMIDGERFEILSVEDVKGRGLYLELLAKRIEGAAR